MARKTPKAAVKNSVKKKEKTNYLFITLIAVLALLFVFAIIYFGKTMPTTTEDKKTEVIAKVNNETIILSELDDLYKTSVPDELKPLVTEEQFLNESLIPQKLILQEAKKEDITATEEEVDDLINQFLEERGMTLDDFESELKEQGLDMDDMRKSFRENIIITKLIDQKIFSGINVTDREVERFYENTPELENISFDAVKESIRSQLLYDKQRNTFNIYVNQLRKSADIEIYLGKEIMSFTETEGEICKEGDKPVIRLFTTTTCGQCEWIKDTFDSVMEEYADNGEIIAYHWELDTGDNTLTDAKEKGIPKSEVEIFNKYSPKGKIPLYVFGCKYLRTGNYYGDDTGLEEKEFRLVVEELLK